MNSIEWLNQLIQFNTVSANSNLELIRAIEEWLKKHQISTRLSYDPTHHKANLLATLEGADGKTNGGLLFSGHTDVVPVEGQDWDSDPFKAVQIGNKIYGRGACDMKGFIAVLLSLVPQLKTFKLREPIHFAFSFDEEVGLLGVPLLIADLQALN